MADIQVLRKTSLTLTETFSLDGAPQDLDSGVPTVVSTAPDGTATTYNAGTTPAVQGAWTGRSAGQYRLVVAAQPEVTWRDLAWTGTIGGQPQTLESRVEWLGALLFNISELRALKIGDDAPFSDAAAWPDAKLHEVRAATLEEFTHFLNYSPLPRFRRETFDGDGGYGFALPGLHARRILSVTVNGVAQTASNYAVGTGNTIEAVASYGWGTSFTRGRRNVVVEWEHGLERVPGDGPHVAQLRAAMRLEPGITGSASTVTTADGMTYSFDAAGQVTRAGTSRRFGHPAIDSWLLEWRAAEVAVA